MNAFKLHVQHYVTHKLKSDRIECEDAVGFNAGKGLFAVADGATEAYGSRYWSRLLVKSWIRFTIDPTTKAFLELSRCLGERAHQRWNAKRHAWYAEEKLRSGSFAAFIGLKFEENNSSVTWRGLSIGDCCLIQCRADRVITSVPLSDPSAFGYHPILLPSLYSKQSSVTEHIQVHDGTAEINDVFLLMSDAAACWFLKAKQADSSLAGDFERLLSMGLTNDLDIFVDDRRIAAEMKDDDISAIYVRIGPNP
jgi:hypothetical protein